MMRSLADRLDDLRATARTAATRSPGAEHPSTRSERAARLARWFGARLEMSDGGSTVVLERSVPLAPEEVAALAPLPPAVYFDTETTGLSTGAGTVPFLAGTGRLAGDRLIVRQLLLPDYPHERALLRQLCAELDAPRLVTYNGRTFDLPLLSSRLTIHGFFTLQAGLPGRHDDLLPVARRLWRKPLGGARLADVEAGVLGVRRASDCPSAEVPARYFGYLASGSPEPLAAVLDHNLQDIVSLARLEAVIERLPQGAWRETAVLDLRGFALELLRAEQGDLAAEVLEEALARATESDAHLLRRIASRLLLSAGAADRAEELWRAATRRASVDAAWAWVEIARIRERQMGDLEAALEAATAAGRVLDLAFALGRGGAISEIAKARLVVDRRVRRLRSWVTARRRRGGALPAAAA